MRRARVHVDDVLDTGLELTLDAERSHHLVDVLRCVPGDAVRLFDGRGDDWSATLIAGGKRARLTVGSREPNPAESPLAIVLWQGLSLGSRMDACLRQAVELGVRGFRPVQARRSQGRLDAKRAAKRHAHWRAIAISASEQCGRPMVPAVHPLADLDRHLAQRLEGEPPAPRSLALVLSPDATDGLGQLTLAHEPTAVDLLIGPESGLDAGELDAALGAGFHPVSVGPRILRTETAGPAAIAILQARFGDLQR